MILPGNPATVPDAFTFFSPWWLFHTFPSPTSETFLPSLSADAFAPLFNWKNCFWLHKSMSTNSPATSTKLLKPELCSHLTVYGFAVLFQSQSLHLDLTSHSPFAFSRTLLQCFSFYCINNFSLSTESSPSACKHIVIALILKKKKSLVTLPWWKLLLHFPPVDPKISRSDFTHCH